MIFRRKFTGVLLTSLVLLTGCSTWQGLPDDEGYLVPEQTQTATHQAPPAPVATEPGPTPSEPRVNPDMDPYVDAPSGGEKDRYLTDPVPAGKPKPVEPQDVQVNNATSFPVTLSIRADTILRHMDQFNMDKIDVLPSDGWIYRPRSVTAYENESVFDVLKRETRDRKIHMEFVWTPIYNSVYVEGINNLYEFDCGPLSGWMYKVNGWFPNYGASRYILKIGDTVEWVYTCDLGRDIGGWWPGMEMS